ncbi:LysR family transcriptional regulator [Phytomonospora sp. NPDC050363]|uniref:LysR family transcriptional regulator n=1 Tax=Phytomonospora sp. NPDC050363 TaxID=3155642 RepID=UPI0033CBC9D1
MDVRQLEYFLAVVDNGGFNRAARALFLAQPSLSQAIRTLERDLGGRLFHRIGRSVVLTEAGEALVEPARQAVRALAVARASVEAVRGLRSGEVAVASMPSPAVEPLSTMILAYSDRYPGVHVSIRAAPVARSVLAAVRTGATELGLLSAWRLPAVADLLLHPLGRQRFVLVAPPDGSLAADGPLPRTALEGRRLIVGEEGTGIRRLAEEIRAEVPGVTIAVESEHREAVLPLVLKGIGVGILAEAWRPLAERAGAVVLDLDPPAWLDLAMVSRDGPLTPAAAEFLAIGLETSGERHR